MSANALFCRGTSDQGKAHKAPTYRMGLSKKWRILDLYDQPSISASSYDANYRHPAVRHDAKGLNIRICTSCLFVE